MKIMSDTQTILVCGRCGSTDYDGGVCPCYMDDEVER